VPSHPTRSAPFQTADLDRSAVTPGRLRLLALVSAVVLPTLLILHGTLLHAATASPLGLLAVLSLVPTVLAVAAVTPAPPRRALTYASVPVAGGLASVALTVGTGWFPGQARWWLPASFACALPLLALARVSSSATR
jgi:hypothetical protein